MKAHKKGILILMLLMTNRIYSQNSSVSGVITSGEYALVGVQIFCKESGTGAISDSSGYYFIKNLPTQTINLSYNLIGHEKKEVTITLHPGENIIPAIDLPEITSQLDELVISGTLKEISKAKSPIPIEVYTPAFFKKNPTPALFEALQMVNGVRPQINCAVCNTGDIHINGMEGPYTLILIDGMPIVSGLGSVYGLNGIPNAMIERIEIVKGPASTLYGSEAVGGLINVITKSPQKVPILTLDAFATDWREFNFDLGLKNKFKNAFSLLGINYFNYQNPIDRNGDNFTDLTNQNRISIFNKWEFPRKNGKLAQVAGRYVYEDRFGGEMQWNKNFRGGDSIYGESIFTSRFELIGNYEFDLFKENVMLQFSYSDHSQNSAYGTTIYIANQKTGFTQLKWTKDFKRSHLVSGIGLRYSYYDDNTAATESIDSIAKNSPAVTWLPGIFLQDEITINEKNNLLIGLRYDYHLVHKHIFSPRINYHFNPNVKNNFRIGIGNGFRVVNLFTEEHAAITGSRTLIIEEELNPERSWNSTLNYTRNFFGDKYFASLDFNAFYTYFSNKIQPDYLSDPNAIIYRNLNGYAVSRGMSLNLEFNFYNRLKILMGATLMDVYRIENGVKLNQLLTERISGSFALTYLLPKLGMSIDYTGSVYGPMNLPVFENDIRSSTSPWYSIMNLQLTKTFKNKSWEIYGGVKNLLNFRPPANSILRAFDPFDKTINDPLNNPNNHTFDAAYVYSSFQGIRYFVGIRFKSKK